MWRTKELAGQWMDAPAMMCTKSWWNAKMHDKTWRCAMKHEDAWARECIAWVRESVLSLACYCREAVHNMWNCSTHDGGVVLWSPVVMSRKIGQYQPVENWVSTVHMCTGACEEQAKLQKWRLMNNMKGKTIVQQKHIVLRVAHKGNKGTWLMSFAVWATGVSQADLKKLECSKELPEWEIKLVRNY
jgi:hypothetical protein